MSPLRFDEALVVAAQGVLAVAGGWAVLLVAAAVVEALSDGRVRALAGVGCPTAWRPVLLALLGAAVGVTGLAGGAAQAASSRGPDAPPRTGLPAVPARPVDSPAPTTPTAASTVTVAPGDSLWSIARARLGDDVGDTGVLALTRSLHRANRAVIGADPDLLHPGQRLRVPPDAPAPREDSLP